jgi:hypothetical protein
MELESYAIRGRVDAVVGRHPMSLPLVQSIEFRRSLPRAFMDKSNEKPAPPAGDYRGLWIVLIILSAALLAFELYRLAQGESRADGALIPAALLMMGLAHLVPMRGALRNVMLVVSVIFTGLALLLLVIR